MLGKRIHVNYAARTVVISSVLCVAVLCGCARKPERLARQVASADHLIAEDPYQGYLVVISGREASDLIRAVSSAKGLPKDQSAATAPGCEIQFLQGTNLLATIPVQYGWFATDEGEFIENSGVLEALQRRVESDGAGRQAWITKFVKEIMERPEFVNLQTWSVSTLQRYTRGEGELHAQERASPIGAIKAPDWMEGLARTVRVPMPEIFIPNSQASGAEASGAECIMFSWHSYGLLVGPSNYTTTFKASYVTNVAPGIYAYQSQ